jgi:hypothetical protein
LLTWEKFKGWARSTSLSPRARPATRELLMIGAIEPLRDRRNEATCGSPKSSHPVIGERVKGTLSIFELYVILLLLYPPHHFAKIPASMRRGPSPCHRPMGIGRLHTSLVNHTGSA